MWSVDWSSFFIYGYPIVLAPFVEKSVLSSLNYLCTFVESVSLMSLFILTPIPYYCSFMLNLFFFLIYFWLCWVFIAVHGLSVVVASGVSLHCGAWASHCSGFSCCRAQDLGAWASVVVARGLSSCGARA